MTYIRFTEAEVTAMCENRILCDIGVDPAENPDIALGVLLDNSTWDRPPRNKAALTSAVRKLATEVSTSYNA